MRKIMNWMCAATLVCGASVFTSCTANDANDNPSQEQAKENRKEFIRHTRQNLKEIAENLNFGSWEFANKINQEFNTTVLNNPEFDKAILPLFIQKIRENIQPVGEDSELAEMGFVLYAPIDLTDFNYRFTMKEDGSGFDVEEAEDFEMIVNGINPETKEVILGFCKLTLKSSGDTYLYLAKQLGDEDTAVVLFVPSEFAFTISASYDGEWKEVYNGSFTNRLTLNGESDYFNPQTDAMEISGKLQSALPRTSDGAHAPDAAALNFNFAQNPAINEVGTYFSIEHNGKNMISLWSMLEYIDKEIDFSKYTGSGTILDLLVALMDGAKIDGATLTLNDDLTTEISISDCGKVMQLQSEMAHARRNYADQATIEGYAQQLNELVSAKLTCDGVNQVIPMKLQTEKFGVDYWAMPAFNFADEQGYVSFTQLLDKESVEYAINIVDHAAEPVAGAIITVRQLIQFIQNSILQIRVNRAQNEKNQQ